MPITFCGKKATFTLPDVHGYSIRPDVNVSPCEVSIIFFFVAMAMSTRPMLWSLYIILERVDYPKKNKRRAIQNVSLYPPRIVIRVLQGEDGAGRELDFPLKLEGINEKVTFNVLSPIGSSESTGRNTSSHHSSQGSQNNGIASYTYYNQ